MEAKKGKVKSIGSDINKTIGGRAKIPLKIY